MFSKIKSAKLLLVLIILLAGCQSMATVEPVVETMVVTEIKEATPVDTVQVIQMVTPSPEPEGSRTLVICLDEEPDHGYIYNFWPWSEHKLHEAIEDGPLDAKSFSFQPVILEKLPSLADGDALLSVVSVSEGDTVVDAIGDVVILDPAADPPIMLIPAGGGGAVPYLGGDFEMEQLSVTFRLLPNLLWSDGVPLTAADSVYTYHLAADPIFHADYMREYVANFEAIDDLTIEWTGLPGYLDRSFVTLMFRPRPEHIWSQYSLEEILEPEELFKSPVGWGPYVIGEWLEGESITLRKNPNYFRVDEGLPKFETVVMRFTGNNANANIAALLSGECDLVSARMEDQIELLLELHEAGKLKATFTTGTTWEHIDFGIQHIDYDDGYQPGVDRADFFSDVRTRQAFAMCMDRQAVVEEIFYGQSLVPDSYVPPQHPLYNPGVRHYEFDVTAGSALLEEIGWVDDDGNPETPRVAQDVLNVPDGTLLEVDYETTSIPVRQKVTAMIKDSLALCGIKANLQLYTAADWFAAGPEGKLFGRRYDLGQFAWSGGADPGCWLYLSDEATGPAGATWISIQDGLERRFGKVGYEGWNQAGFASGEYDRACNTALSSLPGQPEYETAHLEAQRIFNEQLPAVPLYLPIKVTAMRPDMCGVIMDPSAFSEFWNIEEFDYGEGCED